MERKPPPHQKPRPQYNKYLKYTNIGFQMLVIILLGVWGGMQLDKHYETETPWFTMLLSMLAVVIAIVSTITQVIRDK